MVKLIDVGGSEGLHHRWTPFLENVEAYLFECNPEEAQKIRDQYVSKENIHVVEKALWNRNGSVPLNLARHFGCTSVRKPDLDLLRSYDLVQFFETVKIESVQCERYDALYQEALVPIPDSIKIDVQGCEYEVLEGFGALLDSALSIELEAHFYPIYRKQKLIGDLVEYLTDFDFVLKSISPTPHFKSDVVEIDVVFLPNSRRLSRLSGLELEKLALIKSVYGLS